MAYAGSKRFQYQQLQYCPQRNVSSISKEKMFNSTVSKYDPRTGRTTRLAFCVETPKKLPAFASIVVYFDAPTQYSEITFTVMGTGAYIIGDNRYPYRFSSPSTPLEITCSVPPGKTLDIYSENISQFSATNQPFVSINLHGAKTLQILQLSECSNFDIRRFDASILPNLTRLNISGYFNFSSLSGIGSCINLRYIVVGNAFNQPDADSVVNQIIQAGIYNGTLIISYQEYNNTYTNVNITGPIYQTLRNTYNWTIT